MSSTLHHDQEPKNWGHNKANSLVDASLVAQCARARQSRDARFDGLFFIGVKSTGIYCRPICPAKPALESNVQYYPTAISAAQQGYRPCIRCRPDSSPHSPLWQGTETTFKRALKLIQSGGLSELSLPDLAQRIGVSDRYLRKLFNQQLGVSPKQYVLYQQCLFAKKLLQETKLPIQEVAFAAGFNSIRRFNDTIRQQLALTPSQLRKTNVTTDSGIKIKLSYRPPFNVDLFFKFLESRVIPGLEVCDGRSYARSIEFTLGSRQTRGYFTVEPLVSNNCFLVSIQLDRTELLYPVVQRLRSILDLDAPIASIDHALQAALGSVMPIEKGLRVPGIWSTFEAGIRAILGQQVTVAAARNLLISLVEHLGDTLDVEPEGISRFFPSPNAIISSDLAFLKMPQSRKDTMHRLAHHFLTASDPYDVDAWLEIKGIGPWTVNYVKMRAEKDPDVWLTGDAGIKNALAKVGKEFKLEELQPWRSYATLQLWHQLAL